MAFIKVEGLVGDPLGQSGFTLVENVKTYDGRQFDVYWKVWTKTIPTQGAFVEVTGEFSSKLDLYNPEKPKVDRSINDPKVTVLRDATVTQDSSPF
jgi:hypothetical protein